MTKISYDPVKAANIPSVSEDPLVVRARLASLEGFEGKLRKVPSGSGLTQAPYFSHTDEVANLLAAAGFGPETVAAGYLHDHPEDLPEQWPIDRIRREFGDKVAELVWAVTQRDKSLAWEERNHHYLEQLKGAPDEALAVSCADKTSNLRSAVALLEKGFAVNTFLKRGWAINSGKFHDLEQLYSGRVPDQLLGAFRESLRLFDSLGSALEIS